jgi:hypothetical protein
MPSILTVEVSPGTSRSSRFVTSIGTITVIVIDEREWNEFGAVKTAKILLRVVQRCPCVTSIIIIKPELQSKLIKTINNYNSLDRGTPRGVSLSAEMTNRWHKIHPRMRNDKLL